MYIILNGILVADFKIFAISTQKWKFYKKKFHKTRVILRIHFLPRVTFSHWKRTYLCGHDVWVVSLSLLVFIPPKYVLQSEEEESVINATAAPGAVQKRRRPLTHPIAQPPLVVGGCEGGKEKIGVPSAQPATNHTYLIPFRISALWTKCDVNVRRGEYLHPYFTPSLSRVWPPFNLRRLDLA